MGKLTGKVVLVTGASRGIGKAIAIELSKQGASIAINCSKDIDGAEKTLEEIMSNGGYGKIFKSNISKAKNCKDLIQEVINTFGRIDTLVNCAGIVFDRGIYESTIEEFENTLKVNIIGAFMVSREVIKYMKKGSSIVNISSTNGTKVVAPESIDYNISKVGLQSLTRDLAFQFKPNIRVNAVAIGWADTDMNKDLPKDYIEEENNKIYLERFAEPSEIANTIYFLASEESSYINGEILTIDGGY